MAARRARFLLSVLVPLAVSASTTAHAANPTVDPRLAQINHLVVIYLENRSFDHLYGSFPGANGLSNAPAEHATQVDLDGRPFPCLPQEEAKIRAKRPFPADRCADDPTEFANRPFALDRYLGPGDATPDLVHRFYQEQAQINGGAMNKFTAVSNAAGLTQGYYETARLPLAKEAGDYTLLDDFFHAAFGGSFLNHFWLICACTPEWPHADKELYTVLDGKTRLPAGWPKTNDDEVLTSAEEGDFAVNSVQPLTPPFKAGVEDDRRLPLQVLPTIGDRLDGAHLEWAWYAGGWNDAESAKPDARFSFDHQPFNYFAAYTRGKPARAHLRDEVEFVAAARAGTLPAVAFVKPIGGDDEHPGYANLSVGERATKRLIDVVRDGPNWQDTAIVVTYDENGGFWDHVPPPTGKGVSDRWGPGTRVPTIIIAPFARKHVVDHTQYDTTSILATIEHRWGLSPLGTRDQAVADLANAFEEPKH